MGVFTASIRRFKLAITIILLASLSGCAGSHQPGRHNSRVSSSLDNWVSSELTPYLVEQLSRQPRFRNEPILLVAMRDADLQPHIDSLTRSMREKLLDNLLQVAGTQLTWRPNSFIREHHRTAVKPQCRTASNARYFVTIDIHPVPENQVRVKVRALDVAAGSWVSGFGKSWQGRLTASQQQALSQRRTDEYLRGLRILPFGQNESDLAAAYLARNIACVLRGQQILQANITLDPALKADPELRQVLTLVSHNLSKLRGKQGNPDPGIKSLSLGGTLSDIDKNLNQLWVSVRHRDKATEQTLVDTSVYLSAIPASERSVSAKVSTPSTTLPDPAASKPVSDAQGNHLLSALRIVNADSPAECPRNQKGNCPTIEYDLLQPAYVVLLHQSVHSGLRWMPADGCEVMTDDPNRLAAQVNLTTSAIDETVHTENIYIIAVSSKHLATELREHTLQLPSACFGDNAASSGTAHELQWLAELDLLLEKDRGHVDWKSANLSQALYQ